MSMLLLWHNDTLQDQYNYRHDSVNNDVPLIILHQAWSANKRNKFPSEMSDYVR